MQDLHGKSMDTHALIYSCEKSMENQRSMLSQYWAVCGDEWSMSNGHKSMIIDHGSSITVYWFLHDEPSPSTNEHYRRDAKKISLQTGTFLDLLQALDLVQVYDRRIGNNFLRFAVLELAWARPSNPLGLRGCEFDRCETSLILYKMVSRGPGQFY